MMDKQRDDLTRIKGISETRQEWFAENFQVTTFQKLADLPAEEVQQTFKRQGRGVSLQGIESWIVQARKFAAEAEETESADSLADVETSPPLMLPKRKDGWKPFASFVVEFQKNEAGDYQTMAHFMEKDLSERWPGVEAEQVCVWMQDQRDVPTVQTIAFEAVDAVVNTAVSSSPQSPTPAKKKAKSTLAAHLQIDAVTILDEQGTPPANIIFHEHDWQIQIDWALDESDQFPENGRWLVHAFLESMGKGLDYDLAAKQISQRNNDAANKPGQQKFTTKIAVNAHAPGAVQAGIYKMVVTVTAQDENQVALPLAAFKEGGVLSVY